MVPSEWFEPPWFEPGCSTNLGTKTMMNLDSNFHKKFRRPSIFVSWSIDTSQRFWYDGSTGMVPSEWFEPGEGTLNINVVHSRIFNMHTITTQHNTVMTTQEVVSVYVDGSCVGNGEAHAKGASAVLFPNGEMDGGAYYIPDLKVRTNNRMEYYAIIKAMELADELDPERTRTIHVHTDCMLAIKTCTQWMESWKKKGWIKSSPGEIKNLDLIKTLYDHCCERKVLWTHVRAHQKDDSFETKWNNLVDKCAYEAVATDDVSGVVAEETKAETLKSKRFFKNKKRKFR